MLSLDVFFLACLILTTLPGEAAQGCEGIRAKYKLEFVATWSAKTHPGTGFPSNGHFSPLIGASHNSNYKMWASGILASEGVKSVAETGNRTALETELNQEISKKTVLKAIKGRHGTLSSPGNLTDIEVIVCEQYPLVSVITKVAPSPDWFVGVHDLNLCGGQSFNGNVSRKVFVYDAGTDNGTTFNSKDSPITPRVKIFVITKDMDTPFGSNTTISPLGEMLFTKIEENKTEIISTIATPTVATTSILGNQTANSTAIPTAPMADTTSISKAASRLAMEATLIWLLSIVIAFTVR